MIRQKYISLVQLNDYKNIINLKNRIRKDSNKHIHLK